MKKNFAIILFTLLAPLSMRAASMVQADSAYMVGNYDLAVTLYEQLLDQGYRSANLHYNAGNAYFRQGKLADAIIQYERALRIDATHQDAQHNLAFAQAMTVDKIDAVGTIFLVDWWRYCYKQATADTWAYCSVALFVCCLCMVALFVFGKAIWLRKTGFSLAIVTLLFAVVTAFCASSRHAQLTNTNQAIVYVPTVTTKSSPDNSGNDLFILHEGTKVIIKSQLGTWSEIQTEDGNTGWLPASTIVII